MKIHPGNSYYVGDPVHVLSDLDMYSAECLLERANEASIVIQGCKCWVCRVNLNMEYVDQNMNPFELPSDMIAVIHSSVIDNPEGEEHGVMIQPEGDELVCGRSSTGDMILIGNLVISRV